MKTDLFINKSILKHGDKYDYSKVEYISSIEKVVIICKEHGEFLQTPNNHLNKQGCYKCKNNSQKFNLDYFIKKSIEKHSDRYDYSKVEYKSVRTDIIIICKEHGDFLQKPNKHINGQGCMKCRSDSNTLTTNEFIDKAILIHKDRYDYSLVNYKSTKEKIIIICEEHSEFVQTPMKHLSGAGCPKCGNKFGIMENRWLDNYNINNENRQVRIGRYKVDGYDPITNTVYEFNGDYWHGNPNRYDSDDINKVVKKTFGELYEKTLKKEYKLKKLGYRVVSIWESDYLKEKTLS